MIIDHTDREWRIKYIRKGRENGAATYSKDIVKYYVPKIKAETIITCPLKDIDGSVQFLHEYPYDIEPFIDKFLHNKNTLYITAYDQFRRLLTHRGLKAEFVPMAIDSDHVQSFREGRNEIDDTIIYFGNVTTHKNSHYQQFRKAVIESGLKLETISGGIYKGRKISQKEAWKILSHYKYAAGVGRCYQEAAALGCKVFISGAEFGGITITEEDHNQQIKTNYNGRIITTDRDIKRCIELRDSIISRYINIKDVDIEKINARV